MSVEWSRRRPLDSVRRGTAEIRADVDEELRFHLAMRIDELQSRGFSAKEAHELALRQFGDLHETREVCVSSDAKREQDAAWKLAWDELKQDLRQGLRHLRRQWRVTLLAVGTLAVGIGASTSIFSVMDHVMLRPLPYEQPDRIVTLWETNEREGKPKVQVSPGTFLDWQQRSQSFAAMGLVEPNGIDLKTDGPPLAIPTHVVTAGFFDAIGAKPVRGRTFTAAEHQPGAERVVMISEGLWQRQFGGAGNVVGSAITLNDQPYTVVGIVPASLKYPKAEDVWLPKVFREDEPSDRYSAYMDVVARLKPGVTVEQARAEMALIAEQLAKEFPRSNGDTRVNLIPLDQEVLGKVRPVLIVLFGAVAFVLLIACANVASLLLSAGAERGRELAVRASLGAARRRLLSQLATESVLLALIGGVFGLLLAYFSMRALVLLSPPDLPRVETIAMNGRVLTFSALVTMLTAFIFGLAPALRFSRPDLLSTLRASGRSLTPGRSRNRLRAALVISEVALALMLLVGAGLLMRSFVTLLDNDLGFEPENRATLQIFLWDRNPTSQQRLQRALAFEQSLRSTPGVVEVGVVSALPFHPYPIDATARLRIVHRPVPAGQEPVVFTTVASPSYFRALGVPLIAGRLFNNSDRMGTAPVVLINQALARQHFAGEDPVGKIIEVGAMGMPKKYEIVGVVGDMRPRALDSDARPELFVAHEQMGFGALTFVVKTDADAAALMPTLRARIWDVDPDQSIFWTSTIEQLIGDTLVARRFNLILLGTFSAIALVLASIGIYGLISFATIQRTSEIGVRMALGAERVQIVRMIVSNGLRLALPGIAIGIVGALALTRFLQGMLYGIKPTDPVTFVQTVLVMIGVAAAAAYIPARRVVRANPLRNIQFE